MLVIIGIAQGHFLRARLGRKPQVHLWNFDDIRHTFGNIITFGLGGHVAD